MASAAGLQQVFDNQLRYGDFVTLRNPRWSGYLSGEGILNNDVFISDSMGSFEDHVFQVVIQCQYSAKSEYEDFLTKRDALLENNSWTDDDSSRKHFNALSKGKSNEVVMNELLMRHRTGAVVKFGDIIQLLHVKSKKYLYVPGKDLARDERENMLLTLSAEGGVNSWLQLLPRLKINKEGDGVPNSTEIVLRIAERGQEHVHCSERAPNSTHRMREVNVSIETQSSFRLSIYHSTQFPVNQNIVMLGELVYIRDPEVSSNLQTFSRPTNPKIINAGASNKSSAATSNGSDEGSEDEEDEDDKDDIEEDDGDVSISSAEEFENEFGTVTLKPSASFNSNSVWVLESQGIINGGALIWRTDQVYLRHLNSGRYLSTYDPSRQTPLDDDDALADEHDDDAAGGGEQMTRFFRTSPRPNRHALFSISALHSSTDHVESSGAIQLRQVDMYLERSPIYNDRWQTYPCGGTRNKLKAVGLIINKYSEEVDDVGGAKDGKIKPSASSVTDIHFGLSIHVLLRRYLDAMIIPGPRDSKATHIWPSLDEPERAYFGQCVERIILFIKGYPVLLDSMDRLEYRIPPAVCKRRQDNFLEQGCLELLIKMLGMLVSASDRIATRDAHLVQFAEGGLLANAKFCISNCLKMLYEVAAGNKANQMYIAEFMPVVLAHCGADPLAAKITQELLSTNRELQETKITVKDINVFSTKIKESGMTPMFLRLLQSCCANTNSTTGQQEGVQRNQSNVLSILFGKHKDSLVKITTLADVKSPSLVTWGSDEAVSLYIPGVVQEPEVKGADLFSVGLPIVQITWNTKVGDLNPAALTGKQMVKIFDLIREDDAPGVQTSSFDSSASSSNMLGSMKRQASRVLTVIGSSTSTGGSTKNIKTTETVERRKQVMDFLVAQLYLCAHLCIGRNYSVLTSLEQSYKYSTLIAIFKDPFCPPALQGAAACLITNLYIDRDPQIAITLPRLTRKWTEMGSESSSNIYSIGETRKSTFVLPQLLIADHLRSLKNKPFNAATNSVLLMLKKLVLFGYYGEREKLIDIILPLLQALKRDEMEDDGTGMVQERDEELQAISSLSAKSKRRFALSPGSANKYKIGVVGETENGVDAKNDDEDKEIEMTPLLKGRGSSMDLSTQGPTENEKSKHEQLLEFLESFQVMYFMVFIVVLAVAEAVWSYIVGPGGLPDGMSIFEFAVFSLFALDVSTRLYLHTVVRNSFITFFTDIFNIFDWAVVIIDVVVISGEATTNGGENIGKVLRVVRVLRVLRAARFLKVLILYRAVRLMNQAAEIIAGSELITITWKEPDRYSKTPDTNIQNLVEICNILSSIQLLVEDRNLSLLLNRFYTWNQSLQAKGAEKDKVEQAAPLILTDLEEELTGLGVSSLEWDDIYLDLLMYNSPTLVQGALNILMAHHCNKKAILDNCARIQLLANQRREGQYLRLEALIKMLNSYTDTFEVWGPLKSEEAKKINTTVHDALVELTVMCQRRREKLKIDEEFEPDTMVQDILRNLGGFELLVRIMRLHSTIDVNNTISQQHSNTRQLVLEASRVIYWMTLDNPKAQLVTYEFFSFFTKLLDEKVESHRIIAAIFRDNEFLSKSVTKQYISDFVNMIINSGRFPQYLTFLNSIAVMDDKNIIENQYEIIRLISAPYNQKRCVLYFVPASHPNYAKKIKDMAPFLNKKDVSISELPSDLAYHLDLIQLLGRCTVGRDGMTTIEAKVQSMYSFVDIVESMLDPACLLIARVRYGQFLYNAMLEVEMRLPSLKDAKCIWDLLESMQDVVAFAKDEVRQIEKNGWQAPTSNRQKLEYMLVCAQIVTGYLTFYFDTTIFRPEVGQIQGVQRVQIREKRAWEIVQSLFYKFKAIYDMQTPLLTTAQQGILFQALEVLNATTPSKIVARVENLHGDENELTSGSGGGGNESLHHSAQERALSSFLQLLHNSDSVQELLQAETLDFIEKIESLPKRSDVADGEVRFEPLLEKLVAHIRSTIKVVSYGGEVTKFIDEQASRSNMWLIRIFRLMIEKRWGMTIFERDDDGGEEQDEAAADIMEALNQAGATEACLDLIARGIKPELQAEAIKLLVALLFKEGGALSVQKSINNFLVRRGSHLFFLHMRSLLQNLISWHKWHGVIVLEEGQEPELPDEIILVRMLQLMCEGHYKPNQDIMREQPNNPVSVNLLDDFVSYLIVLDPIPCRTSTTAALAVTATVLEVIQGPCEKNQDHFALTSELLETLNRKLRQRPLNDCEPEMEYELKKVLIDILQGLLEGQGRRLAVFERVLSVIHLDVIKLMTKADSEEEPSEVQSELMTEALVLLRILLDFKPSLIEEMDIDIDELEKEGSNVVSIEVVWRGELQRRFFPVPEICADLAKSTKDAFIANADRSSSEGKLFDLVAAGRNMYIEILHQQVLKEYGIASIFSRTMLERVSWLSLILVCIINALFISYYTNSVISCASIPAINITAPTSYPSSLPTSAPTAIPTSTPTANPTFKSAWIEKDADAAYSSPSGGYGPYGGASSESTPCLQASLGQIGASGFEAMTDVSKVCFGIGVVLVITAVYNLVNCFVVRIPVVYTKNAGESSSSVLQVIFMTASDGITLYHSVYLVLAVLSLQTNLHHIASILLLDVISKSKTTQETLMALWKPRRTIALAMLLMLLFNYIYAIFWFFFLQGGRNGYGGMKWNENDISLRNTFMVTLRWGSPYGSLVKFVYAKNGIFQWRWFWDFTFFMMCFTMWNVIKGIVIDTFVELRTELAARIEDTTQKCFICGIEKLTFTKALSREAFDRHIKKEQNLWNYIYYLIFIWEQDKDDDDGLEYYIRHAIDDGNIGWFPMNKAIRLTEHIEKGEATSLQYLFRQDLRFVEANFNDQVTVFKDELTKFITKVENTVMFVPDSTTPKRLLTTGGGMGATGGGGGARRGTGVSGYSVSEHSGVSTPGNSLTLGLDEDDGADGLREVTLSILRVEGIVLPSELTDRIHYRLITDKETSVVSCIESDNAPGDEGDGDGGDGKVSATFEPNAHLVHRGRLPSEALYSARIQILYRAQKAGEPLMLLGAADVSINSCLAAVLAANAQVDSATVSEDFTWEGNFQVAVPQRAFLLRDQENQCSVELKITCGSVLVSEMRNAAPSHVGVNNQDGSVFEP